MTNFEKRAFLWLAVAVLGIWLAAGTVKASSIVGFDAKVSDFDIREDGSELPKDNIKAFRMVKVGEDGLEVLTPDIVYDKEAEEVAWTVYMLTDVQSGMVDLCAMTIDTFDQVSTTCRDVTPTPFDVPPPGAPGNVTVTQSLSIQLNITAESKSN